MKYENFFPERHLDQFFTCHKTPKFNEKVTMDVRSWNGKWILHVIDLWFRFTISKIINRKKTSAVINIQARNQKFFRAGEVS